jgi:hypothetical protein
MGRRVALVAVLFLATAILLMNVAYDRILSAFWNASIPILESAGKLHSLKDSIVDYSPPVEMFYPVLLVALLLHVPIAAILFRRWLPLRIHALFVMGAVMGHVLLYPWLLRNVAAPVMIPQPPIQIYQLHAASVLSAAIAGAVCGFLRPARLTPPC